MNNMILTELEKHLLNDYQHGFPLTAAPYADIAAQLGVSEAEVLQALETLTEAGVVSRVGAVFAPNHVGVSTLAAMSVPAELVDEVAGLINSYRAVNHNYEREHAFNIWFVATAPDQASLDATLADIEKRSGYAVMSLPMVEDYHIDLGFPLQWGHGLIEDYSVDNNGDRQ